MCLLASILDHSVTQTVCRVEIGPDSLFVQADGGVPAWVGLEYMAQCVAAHGGLLARARGEPVKVGFLIGCRRLEFLTPGYRVGQSLIAVARHVWGQGELASFACRLADARGGAVLVEGQLSVVLPDTLDAVRQDARASGK
jgi:predicted hotdog family 3-hydroxylacyl-ACP dehydratase